MSRITLSWLWEQLTQWLTPPRCFACHWLLIKKCQRLQIYLLKLELLIGRIITNSDYCTAGEGESQQSGYHSDSSNLPELSKSTGWVMKLRLTWISALEKVPFEGFSACERTYYGLTGTQRHLTVISTSSQETNTPQKASSLHSNTEMQPSCDSEKFWGTNYLVWCKRAQWRYEITQTQLNGGGI